MTRALTAFAALSLAVPATAASPPTLERRAELALERDETAHNFVEGLTTEVGPRQAGTEAEARARE
ncbi:MAG: hypothetical protein ACKO1N_02440 [Erythrobacter sp.]